MDVVIAASLSYRASWTADAHKEGSIHRSLADGCGRRGKLRCIRALDREISETPSIAVLDLEKVPAFEVQCSPPLWRNSHISSADYCYYCPSIDFSIAFRSNNRGRQTATMLEEASRTAEWVGQERHAKYCRFSQRCVPAFPRTGIAQMTTIKGNKRQRFPVCPGVL